MENEYNAEVIMEPIGERIPRWLKHEQADASLFDSGNLLVRDRQDQPLVLFRNEFALNWFKDKNPDIELIDLFETNNYQ